MASSRLRTCAALALCGLLAAPSPARAWGFSAHRMIHRKAVTTLPLAMRGLFEPNAAWLAEHAIDPDLDRVVTPGEAPNHFLDLDALGDCASPVSQADVEARKIGRLPWRVGEVYAELVAAFRSRDAPRILDRAARLGHYVADSHVPFHAVANYDGQLSGQPGIHERWESRLVEHFQRQIDTTVHPVPARTVSDPVAMIVGVLRESCAAAELALASDRAAAGPADFAETPEDDRYDDAYYSRLYEKEGERLRSRLGQAATAVGSLWLSAWEEAGRPALPAFRFRTVRRSARAILVSLDGGAATLFDDAIARGLMPNLARLRQAGATAQGSVGTVNTKTAPGHAALFTGAWSDVNGVTGNDVPVPDASIVDVTDGYTSGPLRAEPLWVTAARQGLTATVATATQVYPFAPYFEERRFGGDFSRNLILMDGYRSDEAPERVYRASDLALHAADGWRPDSPRRAGDGRQFDLALAGTTLHGLVYDDPDDPVPGLDTLILCPAREAKGCARLKPTPLGSGASAFEALRLETPHGEGGAYFRLFSLKPDGSDLLLYRSGVRVLRASSQRVETAVHASIIGFVANGGIGTYERGDLGLPLFKGGDGTAEKRYLETAALVAQQAARLDDFCIEHTGWDVLFAYLPFPDEALHLWLGYLDTALPGHDPALAERLYPYLDAVFRLVDGYLGDIAAHAPKDTILAVAADHGMVGANTLVRPNAALVRSGILALDDRGKVDLSRTRAMFFAGNAGYVLINSVSHKGGIVRPEDEDAVRREVETLLRALRDPATGKAVIEDVVDARRAEPGSGIGGPAGGDLYLRFISGYGTTAELKGEAVERVPPRGVHFQDPERREMQAGFAVVGPGVAVGADLGRIRQVDIAPTLAALLGIEPPRQATGVVLDKVFAAVP